MELILLLLLGGAFGVAIGSQFSRQPPQITVVQVQPEDMRGTSGGCFEVLAGSLIFFVLAWLLSNFVAS